MTIDKVIALISTELEKNDIIEVLGIHEDEHKPHAFHVDEEHTAYARDTNEGVLDENILSMFPCAKKGCKLGYAKHTARRQLMLALKQDITQPQAADELIVIRDLINKHGITKIAFVEGDKENGNLYKFI